MASSRYIGRICLIVTCVTLLVTALFMNGEAVGLASMTDGDGGDGQFTENDLDGERDFSDAVRITLSGDGGTIDGGGAFFLDGDVHILSAGEYVLTGELTDGSVVVDAEKEDKIWILLDGVSLHCERSAALRVEQAEKVFLTLAAGTDNSLSGGVEYAQADADEGIDGVIYSRDDLTINGSGRLRVDARYQHGIVCNDDLAVTGGEIEISAVQDGIHANDSARFTEADVLIRAGDDGVTVSNDEGTGYLYVASGSLSIPSCYEGLEAQSVTIAGGTIEIYTTDDGINAGGGADALLCIEGGDITVINETGRDADGLDSNGDIRISGGSLLISMSGDGGSCAIDYGSENGGSCRIDGGTVMAAGSSAMAEAMDPASEQAFLMHSVSAAAGTTVTLRDGSGTVLLEREIPCSFSSLILSGPDLRLGETYTLSVGGEEEQIMLDNSSDAGGFGRGGRFGGGMPGGRGMGRMFGAEMPEGQMPEGEAPDGRGAAGMSGAEMPEGETPEGEAPGSRGAVGMFGAEMPEGETPEGEAPGSRGVAGMFGAEMSGEQMPEDGASDGRQFAGAGRMQRQLTETGGFGAREAFGAQETPPVSGGAVALIGISALALLAGILIAVRHR